MAKAMTGAGRSGEVQREAAVVLGEHVARVGLLELGDRTDVAGTEILGVLALGALGHEQLADALLVVRA